MVVLAQFSFSSISKHRFVNIATKNRFTTFTRANYGRGQSHAHSMQTKADFDEKKFRIHILKAEEMLSSFSYLEPFSDSRIRKELS